MVCEHIGYFGSCLDSFTMVDIIRFGIIAMIVLALIKIFIINRIGKRKKEVKKK